MARDLDALIAELSARFEEFDFDFDDDDEPFRAWVNVEVGDYL